MKIESDKVEKLCTELEAIIYGQIRGNSICGMISKRRSHSRSRGDSSSGSSNSNSAIHNRSCSKSESRNTGIISYDDGNDNDKTEQGKSFETNNENDDNNEENASEPIISVREKEQNKSSGSKKDKIDEENDNPVEGNVSTFLFCKVTQEKNWHYSSNANKIQWIAFIKDDQYILEGLLLKY